MNHLNLVGMYKKNNVSTGGNINYFLAIDGLSNGNMDAGLYDQYENYVPRRLNQSDLTVMLQAYMFALIDLQLYLDTHPSDAVTKDLFNRYLKEYNRVKEEYEQKMGPLTVCSDANLVPGWVWQKKWPFEGGKK